MKRKKSSTQWLEKARGGGLVLVGYRAWLARPQGWGVPRVKEKLGPSGTRAIWDDPQRPGARLAVMVEECGSSDDALRVLAQALEANQLATLPQTPEGLGDMGFMHPEGVIPAVYFVRGNLMVLVTSFGSVPVEVRSHAASMDAEFQIRPEEAREGGMDLERGEGGGSLRILSRAKWRGEDGYLKAFAPGASLGVEGGSVVVKSPSRARELQVFLVESGRETRVETVEIGEVPAR